MKLLLCIILHVLSLHTLRQEDKSCLGILCGFEEYSEIGDEAIATENPGPEDSDVAETDDTEKGKKAEDTTPEKATEVASEKATTKVAADATPRKVSTEIAETQTQEVSSEKAEMAVQEDSTELAANKDFELVIAEALKKVDLNLSA